MFNEKKYKIFKNAYSCKTFNIDKTKLNGFLVHPKNEVEYSGIKVNSLLMIKPSFVEKVLKKKNKRKIEYYLNYIIELIDSDDASDGTLREALNSLSRYRDIVRYKYSKYLDEKYLSLLIRKIDFLENQLKSKIVYNNYYTNSYDIEETKGKSR